MVSYAADRRYLPSHEWVMVEGDEAIVGISDYAQHELSDIVYVELPEVGETLAKGDSFGTVESVKAASDVYLPLSGEIIAANEELMAPWDWQTASVLLVAQLKTTAGAAVIVKVAFTEPDPHRSVTL